MTIRATNPRGATPVRLFVVRQTHYLLLEIAAMLSGTVICLALSLTDNSEAVNYLAPAIIIVVGGTANIYMVLQDSRTLLTPLFAMRLIAIVVFGIGSILHNVISPTVQSSMDYMLVTNSADAARVNLLWLFGMDAMLVGVFASMKMFAGMRVKPTALAGPVSFNFALALFWVGFAVTVIPLVLSDLQIPSIIQSLVLALELSGMFLMGRTTVGAAAPKIWTGTIVLGLFITSLYFMNKSIILYPVLCLVLGFISERISVRRILLGSIIVASMFVVIAPIVADLRQDHFASHGSLGDISFSEQMDAVVQRVGGPSDQNQEGPPPSTRLDYVVPAAFAMNQKDSGFGLDFIAKSGVAFIPRFLWPDKPVITTGDQVNYRMGFQGVNNIGVTVFADLYWNFGWLGLILALGMGVYCGAVTILSRELIRLEDWFMLPFVMSAFRMAVNLDSEFVAGILVPSVLNFLIFFVLRAASGFLTAGSKARAFRKAN